MKKHKHFYCDLFGVNIFCFHECDEKVFKQYMLKNYSRTYELKDANGFTCDVSLDDSYNVFIWTRPGSASLASLVHECLHATNMVLSSVGVMADFRNDELQAYYLQRLFKFCIGKK